MGLTAAKQCVEDSWWTNPFAQAPVTITMDDSVMVSVFVTTAMVFIMVLTILEKKCKQGNSDAQPELTKTHPVDIIKLVFTVVITIRVLPHISNTYIHDANYMSSNLHCILAVVGISMTSVLHDEFTERWCIIQHYKFVRFLIGARKQDFDRGRAINETSIERAARTALDDATEGKRATKLSWYTTLLFSIFKHIVTTTVSVFLLIPTVTRATNAHNVNELFAYRMQQPMVYFIIFTIGGVIYKYFNFVTTLRCASKIKSSLLCTFLKWVSPG
jgi:hypothetical protein